MPPLLFARSSPFGGGQLLLKKSLTSLIYDKYFTSKVAWNLVRLGFEAKLPLALTDRGVSIASNDSSQGLEPGAGRTSRGRWSREVAIAQSDYSRPFTPRFSPSN